MSNMNRRGLVVALSASMILLLAACGSEAAEQAQVVAGAPTPLLTTAPLSLPTPTPVPAPTSAALPEVTSTSVPNPTVAPTPALDPAPSPTPASDAAPASTDAPTAAGAAEVTETPTPVPTPTAEAPKIQEDASGSVSTPVAETPTAVPTASAAPPMECYDPDVQLDRAFVDGVDALSFEGGRVYCTGAGTNAVSAARSYRHSSGLVVHRNVDFVLNDAGTGYIPYSGSVHFCVEGQPASAPFRADTLFAMFVAIDNEAQSQLAQGAVGPATFTGSGSQC